MTGATAQMDDDSHTGSTGSRLDVLYEQIPATQCAMSGACCSLPQDEHRQGKTVMFPLYRAEYVNIVEFIKNTFKPEAQRLVFEHTTERPKRCLFLGKNNACAIYPVRPLVCRTYSVLDAETIRKGVEDNRGSVPDALLRKFVERESRIVGSDGVVCPKVVVTQRGKLLKHVKNLITLAYDRTLLRLSRTTDVCDEARLRAFISETGRPQIPIRWTFGGYNAIARRPVGWMRRNLKAYWQSSSLPDAKDWPV